MAGAPNFKDNSRLATPAPVGQFLDTFGWDTRDRGSDAQPGHRLAHVVIDGSGNPHGAKIGFFV
jgi:hypothetical protein